MSICGAALVTGATIGLPGAGAGAGAGGTVVTPADSVTTGTGGAGTAVTFQSTVLLMLPAASVAVTVIVCGPSARTRSSGEPQLNSSPASTLQANASGLLSRAV